jgi:inosose dehydratase
MTRIHWGTELITYFNKEHWGLAKDLPAPAWFEEWDRKPRAFFDRMLDGARDVGLEGVELAPDPGGWHRALLAYGSAQGFKAALDERGLRLAASYAYSNVMLEGPLNDPTTAAAADAEIAAHAEFVQYCGADLITMGTFPRAQYAEAPGDPAVAAAFAAPVPQALFEKVAKQLNHLGSVVGRYGIRIAIHTDSYSICSRPRDVKALLDLTDPNTIMLCPDSGHMRIDGVDPVAVLRENVRRVPIMHWKDAVSSLAPEKLSGPKPGLHPMKMQYFRIPGRQNGIVDWEAWMKVLRDANWTGWAMLEEDMAADPNGALRGALSFFHGLEGSHIPA